jgi:cyclophilin family peptidyl-prolyl cis-trans isomerase
VAAPTFISPDQATITDKVYMNVRISRQDGTFYVRDDLPDTPENKVFYGRLVFALFGQEAPRHVEKFKSYIMPPKTTTALDNDDDPLPSYDRSTFTSFDEATGVIMGGKIPSLELTEMAGSTALRYGGRLLPASLWLEQRSSTKSRTIISHSARGLLTHRQLEALPDFGITTRSDTTMLDRTHVVFGKLVLDDDAQAFLNIVSNLPTYGMERPNPINNEDDLLLASSGSSSNNSNNPAPPLVDDVAAAVFKAQRQFFRKTAKALGDSRLDKLYEGKLLRRVEVTSTGIV